MRARMRAEPTATYPYPPAAVRRARRRWPFVLAFLLVFVLFVLVVADRISVSLAQEQVADKLAGQRPFTARPSVQINGFPFLTQAARGRYADIEVAGPGQPVDRLGPVYITAHLRGVHLPPSQAARASDDPVPVDRAEVSLRLSLAALAAASGLPGLQLSARGDEVTARAPVSLPLLGTVDVSGTVRLEIESGRVVAVLTRLQGNSVPLPPAAVAVARRALALAVPVADLPYKAVAARVTVDGDDVLLSGAATGVVLR